MSIAWKLNQMLLFLQNVQVVNMHKSNPTPLKER
jgi:hypothetical protein